ncbi:MAG TPA: hypothetical protein PLF42_05425 [Anaerolineales bacterium]|nr:hypothetical protein [Anaerolineales bacterium]
MKSKHLSILFAVIALLVSTLACGLLGGELSLENPRLSTNDTGTPSMTTFSSGDTFYIVADLNNASNGTKVEARWYLENAEGYEAGPISADSPSVLTIDEDYWSGTVNFSLFSTQGGWPSGEYKVELYLDGALTHSVNFSVR